jgi:hypothetical protein
MMTNHQNNPFERLLQYLDTQEKPKKKPPVQEKSLQKKVEKKEVSVTKQLIEESKIHSYIPGETFEDPPPKASEGFVVSSFEKMMRAKLLEEYKKSQSYERPYISVTELCNCIRQCYYQRMKYPVDTKKLYSFSYLYLIQKVGNTIHDTIQELYGFSETEKTIVSDKFKVKGRVDAIKDKYLCEIKSIDFEKFKNKYIKEHYYQSCVYAYILNTDYNYNIEIITIIYVIRNLKKIVPFDLPINNKLADTLLSKAPILLSALQNTQVPDPFGAKKETCKYCLYKKYCEGDTCSQVIQPFKEKKQAKKKVIPENKNPKSAFLL